MVPLRQWDGESMCMAAVGSESSSMPNAGVVVVCESEPMRRASLKVPSSVGFGEASAELPPSVLSLGLALVGAPLMNSGDGGVYLLLDAKPPSPLILSDHSAVQGKQGALGTAVAAGAWDADSALVAMTAPKTRTLVLGLLKEGSATLEVHACLQGQSPWRPMAVTIGDINQEHTASDAPRPDLIVHVDSDGDGAADRIEIYDGKDVPPASGCNPWDGDPVLIDCPQGLSEELRCIDANFAASAAIGDINGDGVGDLLVGAPDAAIGGKLSSGAVVVFPGGARTTSGALRFGEPVLVAHPDPSTGAMLGSSVTTVSTGNGAARRDELVAGAPGIDDASGAVTVFLCTPLLGDLSSEQGLDARCVPEE
ncbi:MAG: FG-GAP repeat protein [Myxococcales bacterium]|nr:FG-GAP repeat protein [Myxococcales bacterium]MCB9707520.1 FG-GAP repeat protein [Myxococcales bacterium]